MKTPCIRCAALGMLLMLAWARLTGQSQTNVFVLIDVSGSVKAAPVAEAREIVSDLVLGRFQESAHPGWSFEGAYTSNIQKIKQSDPGAEPLAGKGFLAFVMWVGEKGTIYRNFYKQTMADPAADFPAFFSKHYPGNFTDGLTFILLAKAQAAKKAKEENIRNYILIEVTDADDDRGAVQYDPEERQLVNEYGASGHVKDEKIGIIRYLGSENPNYKIVIHSVEHLNFNPSNTNTDKKPSIALMGVSKNAAKPAEYDQGKKSFSWSCSNCEGAEYRLIVRQKKGSKYDALTTLNSIRSTQGIIPKALEPGEYEVSVATVGLDRNESDSGYIRIKGGGGGGFWGLLLAAAMVGAVIYVLSRMRNSGPEDRVRSTQETHAPDTDAMYGESPGRGADDDPFK